MGHRPQRGQSPLISTHIQDHSIRLSIHLSVHPSIRLSAGGGTDVCTDRRMPHPPPLTTPLMVSRLFLSLFSLSFLSLFLGIGPEGGEAFSSRHICRTILYVRTSVCLSVHPSIGRDEDGATYRRTDAPPSPSPHPYKMRHQSTDDH